MKEITDYYHSIIIYKKTKNGDYKEKTSFNYLDESLAEMAHCTTVCTISKQLNIPFKYDTIVSIGNFKVRLIKNLPIVHYNINNCNEVVKVSFNRIEIEQSISIMNMSGDNCHHEQYPNKFEDNDLRKEKRNL